MTLTLSAAALAAALVALPTEAPRQTPQVQQTEGHFHVGELGEKYLLLEQNLKCNCGCGLDVHSCQFQMQCGTSPAWSARIKRDLEAGLTPEAIEASFVAEFGVSVLMAPPPEGFNLVGYFLPAVAIITAGMMVGLIVRKGPGTREDAVPSMELTDADMARLQEEIRRLDEAESPDW